MSTFRVDSEVGRLVEVLVCPPTFYEWLPVNTSGIRALASGERLDDEVVQRQHGELVDALRQAEVVVHSLAPRPEHPYMTYTRDSSQMTPWGAVITQMRKPPRWGEFFWLKSFYEHAGQPPWRYITTGSVEGGDISVARPGLLVVGVSGVRTDDAGAAQLCGWFEAEGWRTVTVPFDDHFCHLDLLFTMVTDDLALVCEAGLPDAFLATLRDEGIRTIDVGYRDAIHVRANVLALGQGRVISPKGHDQVNAALRAEGLEVLDPDLSELVKGGGSAHCLTMPLRRE